LLFLDVGLVNFKNGIQTQLLTREGLAGFYRGKIAEQMVGQNLLASQINRETTLYYWAKEKTRSSAEVDFCLAYERKVLGIEVKADHFLKLKSLFSFSHEVKNSVLIRVYDGELKNEKLVYQGRKYKVLSVPFYLINRIIDPKFLF
jgi:hypothetical protein